MVGILRLKTVIKNIKPKFHDNFGYVDVLNYHRQMGQWIGTLILVLMKKCFASGDHGWSQPWHIISTFYHIWHPFWHSFRHSIWHTFSHLSEILSDVYFDILFWHSIWHIFWSSIWHPVWDPIWHKFWHTWHSTRHLWHYSDMFSGIVALSSGPSHSI